MRPEKQDGLAGHGKEFGFYSKDARKPLESFGRDMTQSDLLFQRSLCLILWKTDSSGARTETGRLAARWATSG